MAAVIPVIPYSFLSNPMAGMRVLLREANGGLQFIGGVREPKFTLKTEKADLYDAGTGSEAMVRRAEVPTEIQVVFKATEFLVKNLERFFQTIAGTPVALNAAVSNAPELFTAGKTGERYGLRGLRQTTEQRTALAVYNTTDAALLVLNTDYSVVVQFGITFIVLLVDTYNGDTIRVGTAATASTAYASTALAHTAIAPLTAASKTVGGILQIVSKSGINAELIFEKAEIAGGGDFNLQTKQPSDMTLSLTIMDNSGVDAVHPFGTLQIYGYDDLGAALI